MNMTQKGKRYPVRIQSCKFSGVTHHSIDIYRYFLATNCFSYPNNCQTWFSVLYAGRQKLA